MSETSLTTRPVPWRLFDLVVLYICLIMGATVLLLGWWGTSGTTRLSRQIFWLNIGAIGVLLAAVGNCFWLAAGRRALGKRRLALHETGVPVTAATGQATADVDELVAAANMTRYHRPACPLASGKVVQTAAVGRHRQAGRRPCGVCLPEEVGQG